MPKFIRTTHDDDNEVRDELLDHEGAWGRCGFIVHMLCSSKPLTVQELCDETWKYCNDYNEPLTPKAEIAEQLVIALEHGFAGIQA